MDTMKRSAALSASLLLFGSMTLLAQSHRTAFDNRVLNDVVEMTNAELPDASVLAYVRSRRAVLEQDVTSGDLARLRRAGVSEDVVAYIAHAADLNDNGQNHDWGRSQDEAVEYDGGVTSYDGDGHYVSDNGGGYPYWYAYAPYWYGYGYPYWYGYGAYWYGGSHGHDHGHGHDGHGHGGHGWSGGGHHGGSHGGGSHGGTSHGGGGHSGGGHSGGGHSGGGHGGHH
jgi:hypothetical protein